MKIEHGSSSLTYKDAAQELLDMVGSDLPDYQAQVGDFVDSLRNSGYNPSADTLFDWVNGLRTDPGEMEQKPQEFIPHQSSSEPGDSKQCPNCGEPNQFGELCVGCDSTSNQQFGESLDRLICVDIPIERIVESILHLAPVDQKKS